MDTLLANIPTVALIAAVLVLLSWIVVLELRIKKLLAGKDGRSLEDAFVGAQRSIAELMEARRAIETELRRHDERIRRKLHGVRTLRFNPWSGNGAGGNQSFATAFLDEDGHGVVISTLYSREKTSIFAKPVANRASEFELTEEERAVLGPTE